MSRSPMRSLPLIFLFVLAAVRSYPDTRLQLSVQKETVHPENVTVVKKPEEGTDGSAGRLIVSLGPDVLDIDDGDGRDIYDFAAKKIYRYDTGGRTYTCDSLYSVVGFRVYELENRLFLGKMLSQADVENNPMDVTLSEHLMSLRADGSDADIRTERKEGETRFLYGDRILLSHSKATEKIDSMDMAWFARFIRYRFGVHPSILKELESLSGVPERMTIIQYNVGTDTYSIRLEGHEKSGGYELPIRQGTLTVEEGEGPFPAVYSRGIALTEADISKHRKLLADRAASLAKEGKYLESVLRYLELNLETGGQLSPSFHEYRDDIVQDENVRVLFGSLTADDAAEARTAIDNLAKLKGAATEGA